MNQQEKNYQYTCEQPAAWSPYNANLQMQGIKVWFMMLELIMLLNFAGRAEDTLLLLNFLKEIKMEELSKEKVG